MDLVVEALANDRFVALSDPTWLHDDPFSSQQQRGRLNRAVIWPARSRQDWTLGSMVMVEPKMGKAAGELLWSHTNQDGVCPSNADLDGDGLVGVNDLLILLAAWGPCPDCNADLNGNGTVEVDDLLALLQAWN